MPAPKAKPNPSGLGRAIINRRAKQQAKAVQDELHNTELPSGLHSVTQESNLDEFLNTAQLADTDFTAERNNSITIIPAQSNAYRNPYLLDEEEENEIATKHRANRKALRVPRRPEWSREMDKEELEKNERTSFLEWRRSLADLAEKQDLLLTPFERNLEVWRQLWRTIERSALVVQIVDARNPLNFRCPDLDDYVRESVTGPSSLDPEIAPKQKKNLLLLNKADLLTRNQRQQWANYFEDKGISFAFFSALDAATLQEKLAKQDTIDNDEVLETNGDDESGDDRTRILTVEQLEELFMREAPTAENLEKITIGLVGYPNVGKSSTINALIGAKKVSVSSTPGKTKNFQTIYLPETSIILCDCPGLVFPQFANTKADLILDGVLPIDQMREHSAPVDLLCHRIPRNVLEAFYGLRIRCKEMDEGGTGIPTSAELLASYCIARGYFTQGQGNPDESRAARPILKDYVNGKLAFAHPPPHVDVDDFNAESRDMDRLRLLDRVRTKRAPVTRVGKGADTFIASPHAAPAGFTTKGNSRTSAVDHEFFADLQPEPGNARFLGSRNIGGGGRMQAYPHQTSLGPDGRPIKTQGMMPGDESSKKHHKGGKRAKQRSGAGY